MQLHFRYEKSTKGTHRFQECDEHGQPVPRAEAKVGTLYIKKAAAELMSERREDPPAGLVVTIEAQRGA